MSFSGESVYGYGYDAVMVTARVINLNTGVDASVNSGRCACANVDKVISMISFEGILADGNE